MEVLPEVEIVDNCWFQCGIRLCFTEWAPLAKPQVRMLTFDGHEVKVYIFVLQYRYNKYDFSLKSTIFGQCLDTSF